LSLVNIICTSLKQSTGMTSKAKILKRGWAIEIAAGKSAAVKCCICDVHYISHEYELLSLDLVQEPSVFAVFLRDGQALIASCVFQLHARKQYVEVLLLCASSTNRRSGAAGLLLASMLEEAQHTFKVHKFMLTLARSHINPKAAAFYERHGFRTPDGKHFYYHS
jgi:GNAT superfamily N-acetyltransferase